MSKRIALAAAALALMTPAASEEVVSSPPYTVLVMLSYESPFVDDGRSSFAEFAFSVTFKDVRFHFDNQRPLPMLAFSIDGAEGKGTLTRHALNKVETGGKVVMPKVTKEPAKEFEAWLGITQGPWRKEWGKADPAILSPMPLQFRTSWGMDMMRWDYEVGHSYLEEVGLETFLVDWDKLRIGLPVTLEFPYKGSDPEDKGSWWIEFMPQKKKSAAPAP